MKEQLESALRYLDDSSSITQACIEYGQKTNSTAAVVGLIRVRELIKHAILTNAMHSDGEERQSIRFFGQRIKEAINTIKGYLCRR